VALPSQTIIEFIIVIARQLGNWDIPDNQAVSLSQALINDFVERYKGQPFYFKMKKDCTGKVFMETALTEKLQKQGVTTKKAMQISSDIIGKFFLQYANLHIYVPVGAKMNPRDKLARDNAIVAAYRKDPMPETIRRLASEHNVVVRVIYRVIKNVTPSEKKRFPKGERNAVIVAAYEKAPSPETIKRLAEEHRLEVGTVYGILWKIKNRQRREENNE